MKLSVGLDFAKSKYDMRGFKMNLIIKLTKREGLSGIYEVFEKGKKKRIDYGVSLKNLLKKYPKAEYIQEV